MFSHPHTIADISSGVRPQEAQHLVIQLEDQEDVIVKLAVKFISKVGSELNGLSHQVIMTGRQGAEDVIKKACDLIGMTSSTCRIGLFCDHDHFSGYKGSELAQGIMRELECRGVIRSVTAVGFSGRADFEDVKELWKDLGPLHNKATPNPVVLYTDILNDLFPRDKDK
jgi:hypothetical protein